jgi:predicted dithiol-disulfide oxidoreductase (DUF899 family)
MPLGKTTLGNLPEVVSPEEWLAARKELLLKEKEFTKARDRLNAERRMLPMVRIDKPYTFEGPNGTVSLLDLFAGRQQLVMHHFMWLFDVDADGVEHPRDVTCTSCSAAADCIPARLTQLHIHDTTLVAVSRAPYETIAAYRERMGWTFPWYSSAGSDFNYDFHVTVDDRVAPVLLDYRTEAELAEAGKPWSEELRGDWPGISTFLRVDDEVYHTYSTYGRGIDLLGAPPGLLGHYLDLTALGRQEHWEQPADRATPLHLQAGSPTLRLPDEYGDV